MLCVPLPTLQVSSRAVRYDARQLRVENTHGQQQPAKKEETMAQPKKRAIAFEVCMP